MDFGPGQRLLKAYWQPILAVAVLAAMVAYAASYLETPTYTSSTRVLIRAREARLLSSTGQELATRPGALEIIQPKSLSQTMSGLVTGRPVAEQVVRELKLDERIGRDSSLMGQIRSGTKRSYRAVIDFLQYGYYAERTPYEAAVVDLQRTLEALPIKESYLIEIRARADDPAVAAAIATAATEAFVAETRRQFQQSATDYRDFLAQETRRARSRVEDVEASIQEYKERYSIAEISEALKLAAASDDALRNDLREAEADLADARGRRDSLARSLADLSATETSITSVSGRTTNSTTTTVETGRTSTTTTDDRSAENVETRDTREPNRVRQDVSTEFFLAQAKIAGFEAKRDALTHELAVSARNIAALAEHSAKLSEMNLDRTTSHGAFMSIQGSYENALLNDTRGIDEVRQVDDARVPLYPDRPLRYLFALLGLLCGFGGGLGIAALLDRFGWPSWLTHRVGTGALAGAPQPRVAASIEGTPDAEGPVLRAGPAYSPPRPDA